MLEGILHTRGSTHSGVSPTHSWESCTLRGLPHTWGVGLHTWDSLHLGGSHTLGGVLHIQGVPAHMGESHTLGGVPHTYTPSWGAPVAVPAFPLTPTINGAPAPGTPHYRGRSEPQKCWVPACGHEQPGEEPSISVSLVEDLSPKGTAPIAPNTS